MSLPSPDDDRAIRDLVARYCHAIAERDDEAWVDTWAADATWHVLGRTLEGRDAILAFYRKLVAPVDWVVQHAHDGILACDGDGATGRWQITEHLRWRDGRGGLNVGTYRDVYVRDGNGAWRFAVRDLRTIYLGAPDLSGPPEGGTGDGA